MTEPKLSVRPLTPAERVGLAELLARDWASPEIVSRGQLHDASRAAALGAFHDERLVGLATYEIADGECELLTLNAYEPRRGIGGALLRAAAREARASGARRLRLITTNDNTGAIRFYERQGLNLVAVHHGAVDLARQLKPSIPRFAPDGTRISDEVEFELEL